MAYSIGAIVGGIFAIYVLMRLILIAFRSHRTKPVSVIVAACIALLLLTLVGAYGFANGGPPAFTTAFSIYFVPALVAMLIELFRSTRLRRIRVDE